jgi:hypothetical protein
MDAAKSAHAASQGRGYSAHQTNPTNARAAVAGGARARVAEFTRAATDGALTHRRYEAVRDEPVPGSQGYKARTVSHGGRWTRNGTQSAQHSNRKPKAETPTMRCQRCQSVSKTAAPTNAATACGFGPQLWAIDRRTSIRQAARLPPPSVRARAARRRTARCVGTTHTRVRCSCGSAESSHGASACEPNG